MPALMNKYKTLLFLVLVINSTPMLGNDGWKELINQKGLGAWTQRGGDATYKLVDGVIIGTSTENTPNSFLCTNEDYGDFILEFEVWVDPQLNSGVQIRSQSLPDYQDGRVHGYQVEEIGR